MRIRPNRTVLEGVIGPIRRQADGFGAEFDLQVQANRGGGPEPDLTGAQPGDCLTLFTAVPEALAPGRRYRFEVSVLGGPNGERIVVGKAEEIGPD